MSMLLMSEAFPRGVLLRLTTRGPGGKYVVRWMYHQKQHQVEGDTLGEAVEEAVRHLGALQRQTGTLI